MNQVYSFHETVRGHLHVVREIPCEDYSDSYSAESGKYHIAIVADGHGASECFRSNVGSKAVTEVSMQCLKDFAESVIASPEIENRFYQDLLSNPRYRQMTIRRLTDTIIAEWHDCVCADYTENPPTEDEIGKYADKYSGGNNIPHIYGTTLIAALLLPKCLILLQQGDGRCDVFYADGSVNQPIPWDARCVDTATTSMCDSDVETSIRSCVLDLSDSQVVACYLGCDGIEDAYRDTYEDIGGTHSIMGGVHTFYRDLSCQIATREVDDFEAYLGNMLPDFSANGKYSRSGSGDDVSVAGIVDKAAILLLKDKFIADVEKYALEEDLFWKDSELKGKTRKHDILQKRMNEANDEVESIRQKSEQIEKDKSALVSKRSLLAQQAEETKAELDQYKKESDEMTANIGENHSDDNSLKTFMRMMALTAQQVYEQLANGVNQIEARYRKQLEQLLAYDQQIQSSEKELAESKTELETAIQKYEEAKSAFVEYDETFQQIASERQLIIDRICALSNNG